MRAAGSLGTSFGGLAQSPALWGLRCPEGTRSAGQLNPAGPYAALMPAVAAVYDRRPPGINDIGAHRAPLQAMDPILSHHQKRGEKKTGARR
jgi:hypothetical protein